MLIPPALAVFRKLEKTDWKGNQPTLLDVVNRHPFHTAMVLDQFCQAMSVKEGETRKGSGWAGPDAVRDQMQFNTQSLWFGGRLSIGVTAHYL